MPDFDLTIELSLKIELYMLRPITEKVHSGNGPVLLVIGRMGPGDTREDFYKDLYLLWSLAEFRSVVKDTKSNTKNFTKSISIHSDYQSVHFW